MKRPCLYLALVLTILSGGLAACGDDDSADGTTTTEAVDDTTTLTAPVDEPTTGVPADGESTVLDIVAADFSFDTGGVVAAPAGALVMNLSNIGVEEHQATLVKLNDGVELGDLIAAGASDPSGRAALDLVTGYGGPNGAAPDGGTSVAAANVDPGNYLFLCFIPSPDGVPHVAKGMVAPLTVTEGESAPPPDNEGTIEMEDYSWTLPDDFTGQGIYIVDNVGPLPHELAAYRLADGATIDDAVAFLGGTAPPGPPPFSPAGGLAFTSVGAEVAVQLDLSAGEYAFICFIPDASDGAPHFVHGMIQQVSIT